MTRSAAQMLAHLPGLFQQLLSVAHHLRVSAQHDVATLGVHWQANGLFQRAGFNQERDTSREHARRGFPTDDRLDAQLARIARFQRLHLRQIAEIRGIARGVHQYEIFKTIQVLPFFEN